MCTVFSLEKFKIRVCQGVQKHHFEPFLSIFLDFCLFLLFSTLESCYIWFTISSEYPSAYVYSFALVKFKIRVYLGYVNPVLSHIALFLRFFSISSIFHWNHFGYVMLFCFLLLAPSDLLACGLFIFVFLSFVYK